LRFRTGSQPPARRRWRERRFLSVTRNRIRRVMSLALTRRDARRRGYALRDQVHGRGATRPTGPSTTAVGGDHGNSVIARSAIEQARRAQSDSRRDLPLGFASHLGRLPSDCGIGHQCASAAQCTRRDFRHAG